MSTRDVSFLLLAGLVLCAGCLEKNMTAQAVLEDVNCTHSRVNLVVDVRNPAEISLFTSQEQTSLYVTNHFEKSYLVENEKRSERVLITSGGDEYQTVLQLPQCACLLVDVKTEWAEPVLTYIIVGIQDASLNLTVNGEERVFDIKQGETLKQEFTIDTVGVSKAKGSLKASGVCSYELFFSVDLRKSALVSGTATYSIGQYVTVRKTLHLEGIEDGFSLHVGSRSGNITVLSDGEPNTDASLDGSVLTIPGAFSDIILEYLIVPTVQDERFIFSDQVVSQAPVQPVDVQVEFEPGYAPYFFDAKELSVFSQSPIILSGKASNYTTVVEMAYGPDEIRMTLLFNVTLTAQSNTSAKLEAMVPTDTRLQKIEKFQTSYAPSSNRTAEGQTYYVFEWPELALGETRVLQVLVQATRKAGLFPGIAMPLSTVNKGASSYWTINEQMRLAANSLVGKDRYETVYNVVKHVRDRMTYSETTQRQGALDSYTSASGSCNEYSDIVIGMLHYLDIPAGYVSGYAVQPSGSAPAGGHGWVKVLDAQGFEIEPQELPGALDPYRVEFYTETGAEKSRYWVYGDVSVKEQLVAGSYEKV